MEKHRGRIRKWFCSNRLTERPCSRAWANSPSTTARFCFCVRSRRCRIAKLPRRWGFRQELSCRGFHGPVRPCVKFCSKSAKENAMACDAWRDKLDAFVDGELPPDEARALGRHMRQCSVCAAEVLERVQIKRSVAIAGKRYQP